MGALPNHNLLTPSIIKMYSKCVILFMLCYTVSAKFTNETNRASGFGFYFGDFKFMYSVYKECADKDVSSCLKLKLISAMDRAARMYPTIQVLKGVSFVKRDDIVEVDQQPMSVIEASLPRAFRQREASLNKIIMDKIGHFFEIHKLEVKFPSANELKRSFTGRQDTPDVGDMGDMMMDSKGGSGGLLLMIPMLFASILGPVSLGGLALIAGKALLIAKIALVLSIIVGLKKLVGTGSSTGHSHTHTNYHDYSSRRRSSDWIPSQSAQEEAQKLSYSAYAPSQH